jgi:hypothetical protein
MPTPTTRAMREVERRLLDAFSAGDHPALDALRAQLARATVVSREYTGVGAFFALAIPDGMPRVSAARWVIADIHLRHPQLAHDGGAVLFIENGLATTLEVFSFDEPWPAADDDLQPSYLCRTWKPPDLGGEVRSSEVRDLEWLAESFADARSAP